MENVAIFVSTLGSGGAEKQAALLAQVLAESYVVHFVVLYDNVEESNFVTSILIRSKVNVYRLSGSQKSKFRNYTKILMENKVFCAFNYLTKCDFWGSIIEKYAGVRLIYNGIRNSKIESYKIMLEWFSHNFIATGTIFNCYSGEEAFKKKGFKESKCITIPNCITQIAEPLERKPRDIINIITVGRFHPQKDYETAVKTIALLKNYHSNFRFLLCGYGALEEQIRRWVSLYHVDDVVEFYINPNNIPELLRDADIYLSTSLFEGTSNSIMEAMNWSLPIVATNVGDNNRLVTENNNGFLANVGDVESLTEGILNLINSYDTRVRFGKNSNSKLREDYSIDKFAKRYLSLIEE